MSPPEMTQEIDGDEGEGPPPEIQAPPPKRGPGRPPKVVSDQNEQDARTMSDFIRSLGPLNSGYRFQLYRLEPKQYLGVPIKGYIDTYDSPISEDEVKTLHGGGKYQMKATLPNAAGTATFQRAHVFDVAGDPIVPKPRGSDAPPAPLKEDNTVSIRAMDMMAEQLKRAEDRPRSGVDADAIARAVDSAASPYKAMITTLQSELAASRAAATEAAKPVVDPVRDRILEKVMADDTSRMEVLRQAHSAEVNQLKQAMVDLENRLRDKHDRDVDRIERQHERTLSDQKTSYERALSDQKTHYETQIRILSDAHTREVNSMTMVNTISSKTGDGEVKRLERENVELRAEVKELRAKKDKSIFEQAKEMEDIKELFGGDGEEKKGWERAIEAVGNIPAISKVIGKFAGMEDGQPTGQPQLPPPNTPFVGQDGNTYVHDGQGNFMPVRVRRPKRRPQVPPPPPPPPANATPEQQAAHAEQVAAQQREVSLAEAVEKIDRTQVSMAVTYLETAFNGNKDPQVVAQSVRSQGLVPESVILFLREQGVDALLEKVARLESSSPFTKQAGRTWIRKVAKTLVGE